MTRALTKVTQASATVPALFARDHNAARRFFEFFTTNIRNRNTRKAYARAAVEFAAWCDQNGLCELRDIEPVHVAAYVETLQVRLAAPSVKVHLAAIRMLFDWLVIGQIIAVNPAGSVRGPSTRSRKANAGAYRGGSAGIARVNRCLFGRGVARSRAHCSHGLHVRASAPRSRCGSRTHTCRGGVHGCDCTRNVASSMRCHATTTWTLICTRTSTALNSPAMTNSCCSARPSDAPASYLTGR